VFNPFLTRSFVRSAWRLTVPDEASVSVTLGVRTAPGAAFTSYTLYHAKRRPGEHRHNVDPSLALQSLSWLLWKDDLDAASAPAPKPNDRITDAAGVHWLIDSVEAHLFGEVFHCQTTRAR